MKKTLLLFAGLMLMASGIAHAETRPFNLSLVDPVQIFDDTDNISGVRLNLLYGKNENVKGLDFGIGLGQSKQDFSGLGLHYAGNFVQGNAKGIQFANIVNIDLGDFSGIQFAGANYVKGNATGFQLAYASITSGDLEGIAIGAANVVHSNAKGFKLGIVNYVNKDFTGLQLGLVNIGGLKKGLQIGLININRNKRPLPFFIIANYGSGS